MAENWLGVRLVADHYNVSPQHIRRLCALGRLPCIRIGNAWRIDADFLPETLTGVIPAELETNPPVSIDKFILLGACD